MPQQYELPAATYMATVALRVKNMEPMIAFYRDLLGFTLKLEENSSSIFGGSESNEELLILQELEEELDYPVSECKKFICFSLLIEKSTEFLSLVQRLVVQEYPMTDVCVSATRTSIFLEDLEQNQLEIYCEALSLASDAAPKQVLLEHLQSQQLDGTLKLSNQICFNQVTLKVNNQQANHEFFSQVLGLTVMDHVADRLAMNGGKFWLSFEKAVEPIRTIAANSLNIGIDYLILHLENQAQLVELKAHLEQQQQDYFIDPRQTILTIYGPNGIEWWFVFDQG